MPLIRLDMQRNPTAGRTHHRKSARWAMRGYETLPHQIWGDARSGARKSAATPYAEFPPETTVVASDSTNAARLAGLGFVASPTSAWTTGQYIEVGGFRFNWSSSAWAAGAHA
jgi:hypothetical protein